MAAGLVHSTEHFLNATGPVGVLDVLAELRPSPWLVRVYVFGGLQNEVVFF